MKEGILTTIGVIGGYIASLFGGWDAAMSTLFIFMTIDYITGVLVAGVFHNSAKTESGALKSGVGFQGICRKAVMLLIVLVAYRLDLVLGMTMIQDAATIALIANEAISIIENAGLMGIPVPAILAHAVDTLNQKSAEEKYDH